jgi:hypothetical protein
MAATVCDLDRELILELVTWSSERARTWALTRDEVLLEGDPEDLAEVCGAESRTAERMTTVLRRALRLVVEQEADRLLERPAYDGRRGPRPPRTRTRDDVLPGLDTREPGLFDQ